MDNNESACAPAGPSRWNDTNAHIISATMNIKSIKVGYLKKYQNPQNFQNFMIQNGNIVWGEDWDLIFPRDQLYEEKIIV